MRGGTPLKRAAALPHTLPQSLVVQASPGGIALRDGSSLTPDAILASANNAVCASVVNILAAAVPMPFT